MLRFDPQVHPSHHAIHSRNQPDRHLIHTSISPSTSASAPSPHPFPQSTWPTSYSYLNQSIHRCIRPITPSIPAINLTDISFIPQSVHPPVHPSHHAIHSRNQPGRHLIHPSISPSTSASVPSRHPFPAINLADISFIPQSVHPPVHPSNHAIHLPGNQPGQHLIHPSISPSTSASAPSRHPFPAINLADISFIPQSVRPPVHPSHHAIHSRNQPDRHLIHTSISPSTSASAPSPHPFPQSTWPTSYSYLNQSIHRCIRPITPSIPAINLTDISFIPQSVHPPVHPSHHAIHSRNQPGRHLIHPSISPSTSASVPSRHPFPAINLADISFIPQSVHPPVHPSNHAIHLPGNQPGQHLIHPSISPSTSASAPSRHPFPAINLADISFIPQSVRPPVHPSHHAIHSRNQPGRHLIHPSISPSTSESAPSRHPFPAINLADISFIPQSVHPPVHPSNHAIHLPGNQPGQHLIHPSISPSTSASVPSRHPFPQSTWPTSHSYLNQSSTSVSVPSRHPFPAINLADISFIPQSVHPPVHPSHHAIHSRQST
ncbi:proline-rich protein 36-like [Haliotis cracherodii]|uniref:proline-rich protein 36-like n=1 Tax=Haliotis cracherodii TaxID=6455 RepID=UPI0039EB4572